MATDPTPSRGAPAFDAASLSKLVPGFDFLQSLAKGAAAAVPGAGAFGQWVAPTLDPQELEKKISELRTVQFWLEQNATLLKTTIQALEVQKMTLSTLASMKVPVDALRESLKASPAGASRAESRGGIPALVDPMQWWNALAGQFTELAAQSLKDGAAGTAGTARAMAGAVTDAMKSAAAGAGAMGAAAARTAKKAAGGGDPAAAAASGGGTTAAPARRKAAKRRRPAAG